jgi:hypothetical protein
MAAYALLGNPYAKCRDLISRVSFDLRPDASSPRAKTFRQPRRQMRGPRRQTACRELLDV